METAILLPVHPDRCELIANGRATMEFKKVIPNNEAPFKVYIYCTLPPRSEYFWHHDEMGRRTIGEYLNELLKLPNGQIVYDYGMRVVCEGGDYTQDNFLCQKVIGEFICDYVLGHCEMANADIAEQQGCMHREKLLEYSNGKEVRGLHISDLKIYDEPMKLDEFHKPCSAIKNCPNGSFREAGRSLDKCFDCGSRITRPPQSYCYVEELTNG